jgi:hypothetical protein
VTIPPKGVFPRVKDANDPAVVQMHTNSSFPNVLGFPENHKFKNVGKWAEEISGSFSLARPKSACPKAAQIPTMFL